MLPPATDRPKLRSVLDQLAGAVEDLLLSGLTTASDATRQTISVAMQEAARFRLLRLGSTLRTVAEDLGRYAKHDPAFSRRRLTFFLNRTWILCRGIGHSLETGDEKEYDRLTYSPPTRPVASVDVVCLGVVKRVAAGAVVFDFRLRDVATGQKLSWSAVFPVKPGADVPPEGYLHLPQKQKFTPNVLLGGTTVRIQAASLSADDAGIGRLALTDQSTVTAGKAFAEWARFLDWSPDAARDRLANHKPGPLDLDTELQEEVVLRDYEIGKATEEEGQTVYPVAAGPLELHAPAEGKAFLKSLDELRKVKKNRPPLYGLMHYERCRLVFQPLTTFHAAGPDYLTISKENINKAALLKAMSFT